MKIFLINLDKDRERFKSADAQLKNASLVYERFPAVYAKDLSKKHLDAVVDYFRWWCCIGRKILLGEIGCALSHYSIYQRMIDEHILYACILEDDVVLKENFKETLEKIEEWIECRKFNSQVVLLSNHVNELENINEIREVEKGLCSEAYIITLSAAEALLKDNLPIKVPCDHWVRWKKKGIIKLYMALPSACTQNFHGFESNMKESMSIQSVQNMTTFERVLHNTKRLLGKFVDAFLCSLGK